MFKTGLLLMNVGSPEAPTKEAVGRYLTQFLMDPDVVPLPWLLRFVLVRGLIVPLRSNSSAEKYQKIWTEEGSPLVALTHRFAQQLQFLLGSSYQVEFSMRCGEPSIESGIRRLAHCDEILMMPLFPQYAEATTGSCQKEAEKWLAEIAPAVPTRFLPPFYHKEEFLHSFVTQIQGHQPQDFDHLLFSFHGLPKNQVGDGENSYALHCQRTAEELARRLQRPHGTWSYSFQSRLGKGEWLQPYTDLTVREFPEKGVKRLLVVCPSFVTDCLETLEEIGMGVRDEFLAAGGTHFRLVSCLNADPTWVKNFACLVEGFSGHSRGIQEPLEAR